jgi:hypothetical protein
MWATPCNRSLLCSDIVLPCIRRKKCPPSRPSGGAVDAATSRSFLTVSVETKVWYCELRSGCSTALRLSIVIILMNIQVLNSKFSSVPPRTYCLKDGFPPHHFQLVQCPVQLNASSREQRAVHDVPMNRTLTQPVPTDCSAPNGDRKNWLHLVAAGSASMALAVGTLRERSSRLWDEMCHCNGRSWSPGGTWTSRIVHHNLRPAHLVGPLLFLQAFQRELGANLSSPNACYMSAWE